MIAKYNNQCFCVDISTSPAQIWSYAPIERFAQKITRRGTVFYEKFVELSELDEVFDVGFSAFWNGQWCGVHYSAKTDEVGLYSNNPDFAKEYGMRTIERFAYEIVVPANTVTQYKFIYKDVLQKTEREEIISLEQLRTLWKQFKTDLMPPRN